MYRLIACAIALAACSSTARPSHPAPVAAGIPTRIENHSACDVRVRVYEESTLLAVHSVTALTSIRVRLVPLERSHALRFVAEPFACGAPYTIATLNAVPEALVVAIENARNLSSVRGVTR